MLTLVAATGLCGWPTVGFADGGALQFSERAGRLQISAFTNPGVPTAGNLEVNVLVQDAEKRGALLDADVQGSLLPVDAPLGGRSWAPPICTAVTTSHLERFPLVRTVGQNLLYYTATVHVPSAGRWRLALDVRRPAGPAVAAAGVLAVAEAGAPWTGYWHLFGLPAVAIGLFAAVQQRRGRRGGAGLTRSTGLRPMPPAC